MHMLHANRGHTLPTVDSTSKSSIYINSVWNDQSRALEPAAQGSLAFTALCKQPKAKHQAPTCMVRCKSTTKSCMANTLQVYTVHIQYRSCRDPLRGRSAQAVSSPGSSRRLMPALSMTMVALHCQAPSSHDHAAQQKASLQSQNTAQLLAIRHRPRSPCKQQTSPMEAAGRRSLALCSDAYCKVQAVHSGTGHLLNCVARGTLGCQPATPHRVHAAIAYTGTVCASVQAVTCLPCTA